MNKVIISHADNYRLENVKEILGATFQNFFGLLAEEKNFSRRRSYKAWRRRDKVYGS